MRKNSPREAALIHTASTCLGSVEEALRTDFWHTLLRSRLGCLSVFPSSAHRLKAKIEYTLFPAMSAIQILTSPQVIERTQAHCADDQQEGFMLILLHSGGMRVKSATNFRQVAAGDMLFLESGHVFQMELTKECHLSAVKFPSALMPAAINWNKPFEISLIEGQKIGAQTASQILQYLLDGKFRLGLSAYKHLRDAFLLSVAAAYAERKSALLR